MLWFPLVFMILLGLASGVIMSLIGASAVMLIVPTLNMFLNFDIHVAIGVSLLVDVLASIVVCYAYLKSGNVELRQGLWIALGSVFGGQLGAGVVVGIPGWLISLSFGIWMVGSGVIILRRGLDRAFIANRFAKYVQFESKTRRILVSIILGFIIGLNCGVFGAGGGILIMLVLMFVLDYPIHKAVGTSTIIMAMTAASATFGYFRQGNLEVKASIIITIGAIIGSLFGSRFANLTSERNLSRMVGGIFISLGIIMTILRFFS
jgi:uncharacterized membrane protein YfcA